MLTGLSSLLFGSGGTDDAAVDQNQASRPTPLNTQEADNGWLLVDVADTEGGRTEADQQAEVPLAHNQPGVRGAEQDEQMENQPGGRRGAGGNAVQQHPHAQRAARATRALALESQEGKVTRAVQRQQRVAKTKPLSRRRLEAGNKARMVQSHGHRPASAHSHVLRPSGQMNGRQVQRSQ